MTGAPIRIVLADDQPLFSAGLKMILRSQADMDLVGDAVNGEAAVAIPTPALVEEPPGPQPTSPARAGRLPPHIGAIAEDASPSSEAMAMAPSRHEEGLPKRADRQLTTTGSNRVRSPP